MDSLKKHVKRGLAGGIALLRLVVSLGRRKAMAKWLFDRKNAPGTSWLALTLFEDLKLNAPNDYHKFLWKNHLFYAETYEAEQRFGLANQKESRTLFLEYLLKNLADRQVDPRDVTSVLDVGCSLGYQLRSMEKHVFPNAERLVGIDIDEPSIREGRKILASLDSKVEIMAGDMEDLSQMLETRSEKERRFDIVVCTGVLMYLDEKAAAKCVNTMLKHTKIMLGLSGPASPDIPNGRLEHSLFRDWDHSLIHNFEKMVQDNGGALYGADWRGAEVIDGNTIYFVFAGPPP